MTHSIPLGFIGFDGVEDGDFEVGVADDDAEIPALVSVEIRFVPLGSLQLLGLLPFALCRSDLVQPMVVLGSEVGGTDILGVPDILATLVKECNEVAPHLNVFRSVASAHCNLV